MAPGLLDRRLLFVTGKGGVGKTAVAAALATVAARNGARVLVSDVDGRGDLARPFGLDEIGFDPTEIPGGPAVMSMDSEAALAEYLRIQLRVPFVGRIGPLAKAFDFLATAAPGVREILRIGKLAYEVHADHYDLVVVDAPASGHVVGHLGAADAIHDIVRLGPVRSQTEWMIDLLTDPVQTGTVVVATPEEMPVTETIELQRRLQDETGVELAAVVANRVPSPLFTGRVEQRWDELVKTGNLIEEYGRGAEPVVEGVEFLRARRRRAVGHLDRLGTIADEATPVLHLPEIAAGTEPGPELVAALEAELS